MLRRSCISTVQQTVNTGTNGKATNGTGTDASAFRIDQKLHQILYKELERPKSEIAENEKGLPEPIYPQKPNPVEMSENEYERLNAVRTWKSCGKPCFPSRWRSNDLREPHLVVDHLFLF